MERRKRVILMLLLVAVLTGAIIFLRNLDFQLFNNNLEAPKIRPGSGTYIEDQRVTIYKSSEDEDINIYYTLDGSDPTTRSTLYEEDKGVLITKTTTLKCIVSGDFGMTSEIAEATYTLTKPSDYAGVKDMADKIIGKWQSSYNYTIFFGFDGYFQYSNGKKTTAGDYVVAQLSADKGLVQTTSYEDSQLTLNSQLNIDVSKIGERKLIVNGDEYTYMDDTTIF